MGLDPASKRALVVKSTQHFHARFASITAEVLYMAAAVIVHYRMIVRLRRVRPRDPVGAKKVGAHRAPPAVGVLQVRVRVVDNVPIALTVNPQKRVSLRWVSEC